MLITYTENAAHVLDKTYTFSYFGQIFITIIPKKKTDKLENVLLDVGKESKGDLSPNSCHFIAKYPNL